MPLERGLQKKEKGVITIQKGMHKSLNKNDNEQRDKNS
jgi:hypothetical protein